MPVRGFGRTGLFLIRGLGPLGGVVIGWWVPDPTATTGTIVAYVANPATHTLAPIGFTNAPVAHIRAVAAFVEASADYITDLVGWVDDPVAYTSSTVYTLSGVAYDKVPAGTRPTPW